MPFLEDDLEVVPQAVTNYYFVDRGELPISFAVLPILLGGEEKLGDTKKQVFLHGTADGGLQKIYKEVTAWKLKFQGEQPEISVRSKDNYWISLLKPRKSYGGTIWTIMITVHMLHLLKRNPETSANGLWDHLRKIRSKYEIESSENDNLRDHLSLIRLFVDRDETLAKSQLLLDFLEKPWERLGEATSKLLDIKQSFIADDIQVVDIVEDDDGFESEEDEESDLFDTVCAICDNGGELLCCEGICMRSFHATKRAGEESSCMSLGYTSSQVEAIQTFLCKNCEYKQHQCFVCGKLASSDKSAGAEVFQCVNATCGHFYHPKCVAQLQCPDSETEASGYEKKISSGVSFTCPVHKCVTCKRGECKEVFDLQFAMCRRCPKSYHRKCLPKRIAFKEIEGEGIIQRAWEDLLPNRILIYCLKHKINEDLGTPIRNHIVFPDAPEKNKAVDVRKKKMKALVNKESQVSDDLPSDRTSRKPVKAGKLSSVEGSRPMEKSFRIVSEEVVASQKKIKPFKEALSAELPKTGGTVVESDRPVKEKWKPLKPTVSSTSTRKMLHSSFPVIDTETELRVISLMEKELSSLTSEDIMKKHIIPSTHGYSGKHVEKTITRGKILGSVEAVQTALQKVDSGGTVEDAKVVCEPAILKQLVKWSNKLSVYLGPFLHGMRYSSFGRHFTKVDRLKEIVNKLQWYVQSGDMIVDFCCGANDFSQIMKETLDTAGKRCNFKNYDLMRPKNDFNFEKRDWMKVQPKELPTGSRLIMGLNPPFGFKAALANKFIDKTLTFKPKLIILIVPKEAQRLDQKRQPYDLIWEDGQSLSGKSFYLPGSIDVNDKQMEQWNLKPPLLYLWSRPDWTSRHKGIAVKHGHTSGSQSEQTQEDAFPTEEHMKRGYEQRDVTLKEEENWKEDNKNVEPCKKRKAQEISKSRSHKRIKSKENIESSEIKKTGSLSDMIISSPDTRDHSVGHFVSEQIEKPLGSVDYQHSYSRLGPESGPISTSRLSDSLREGINERDRRYNSPSVQEDMYVNPRDWSAGGNNSRAYPIRSPEIQYTDDMRARSIDPFCRNPSFADPNTSGRPSRPDLMQQRSSGVQGEEEDGHLLRSRNSVRVPDTGFRQASGIPSLSYGLSTSSAETSTVGRYAQRLDEANYTKAGNFASGGPHQGASGIPSLSCGLSTSGAETSTVGRYAQCLDEANYTRAGSFASGAPHQGASGIPSLSCGLSTSSAETSTVGRYAPNLDEADYARAGNFAPGAPHQGASSIPSSSCGLSTSGAETSTVGRYAQRLDEANYTRAGNFASGAPHQGASGIPSSSCGLSTSAAETSTIGRYAPSFDEANYTRAGNFAPGAPHQGASGIPSSSCGLSTSGAETSTVGGRYAPSLDEADYARAGNFAPGAPHQGASSIPSSSCGLSTSGAETSTVGRYAQRLDEANYTRAGNFASGAPHQGASGIPSSSCGLSTSAAETSTIGRYAPSFDKANYTRAGNFSPGAPHQGASSIPSSSCGLSTSGAETSTVGRYAQCLDEANYTRAGSFASGAPHQGASGIPSSSCGLSTSGAETSTVGGRYAPSLDEANYTQAGNFASGGPHQGTSGIPSSSCGLSTSGAETSTIGRYSPSLDKANYTRAGNFSPGAPHQGASDDIPSSSCGLSTSGAETSTIGRYAPSLDEANYTRAGSFAPRAPHQGVSDMYDMPGMRRDMPPETMGFAPWPQHPNPRPGSSGGWLNQ